MKHQQAPKWLLTTALLAVLGANYSFQSSSMTIAQADHNSGVFELSQVAPTTVSPTATVSPVTSVSPTAVVSPTTDYKGKQVDFKTTEGQVIATGTCADGSCSTVLLNAETLRNLPAQVLALAKPTVSTTAVAAAVSGPAVLAQADSEYDCDFTEDGKPETRAQKRDRLRCEKQEKDRIKSEDRIAKFEDKMENVKDRCEVTRSESKLDCLTREFNNVLNRYSGRNAVPMSVVQRYFKNIIGTELSKTLFNSDVDPETAKSALQAILDGFPAEYAGIRQNILSAIQAETKNRATAINQQYKQADTYAKQNKSAEYLQTMGQAQAAQQELGQMVGVYSAAARTSEAFGEDVSFSKYYQQNYLPSMREIFAGIGPVAATTTTDKPADGGTRQNTRGGTSTGTTPTTGTRGQSATGTTFKAADGQPTQWEFLNGGSSGVRIGNPSTTATGTRGGRSMNN